MRICHVTTRFIRGGADENTAQSCNGQIAVGHDVHLIAGRDADPNQLEILRSEVQVWRVPKMVREVSPLAELAALFGLFQLFRRIKPDIVHTHQTKAGILGRLAAHFARVPIIIHGVHILPFINIGWGQRLVYRLLERLAALVTDVFIDVGEEMKHECIRAGVGRPEQHIVIASGMDLRKFSFELRGKLRWQEVLSGHKIHTEKPRFLLLVSRLEARKGQLEFLPVFMEIARDFPDAVLLIAGEGPDHERITRRISELRIQGRVVMTGFRKDIERLMAIADVGLLTSKREGLPRILIQYALMRLPILAMDIPGSREIVKHGVNGFLVPLGNFPAMKDSLSRLLREDDTRRGFSAAQGCLDLTAWSVEGMNKQIEDVYRLLQQNQQRVTRRTGERISSAR